MCFKTRFREGCSNCQSQLHLYVSQVMYPSLWVAADLLTFSFLCIRICVCNFKTQCWVGSSCNVFQNTILGGSQLHTVSRLHLCVAGRVSNAVSDSWVGAGPAQSSIATSNPRIILISIILILFSSSTSLSFQNHMAILRNRRQSSSNPRIILISKSSSRSFSGAFSYGTE